MIFLRCCLEDSDSSCVFVDFCSHRGRLEGLRPNQIVLMPMTWLPRDPILRFVFGFKLTLKGGVWYYYFYFYMGSPSMRFIKCCRWPKMICKLFASLRRTSSFYYLLTTCFDYVFSVTRIFFLEGREYIILIITCLECMVIYHRRGLLCNGMLRT